MSDMGKIIVVDIIPIIVIMALGYVCGKLRYFDDDQRQGLNKVVLDIALPAALFVSIVKASREMLAQDLVLTLISVIGIVAMFMLSYFLCRLLFKHNMQEAAVCALIAGSPTIGFLGFAVLDPIYGNSVDTNLVIAIVSIVVNAITIPIGMTLVNMGQAKTAREAALAAANSGSAAKSDAASATAAAAAPAAAAAAPAKGAQAASVPADATAAIAADASATKTMATTPEEEKADRNKEVLAATASNKGTRKHHGIHNKNLASFINAMKQPVCWAPVLAVVIVLIGIQVPSQVDPTFDLIAKANSGVAVLAAGLALSTVKFGINKEIVWNVFFRNLLTPAVFVVVGLLCGMAGDGDKLPMLVMSVALPPAFSGIIISSRYNIYVKEGASTVAVSTVVFAATCILWAWLVPVAMHMF